MPGSIPAFFLAFRILPLQKRATSYSVFPLFVFYFSLAPNLDGVLLLFLRPAESRISVVRFRIASLLGQVYEVSFSSSSVFEPSLLSFPFATEYLSITSCSCLYSCRGRHFPLLWLLNPPLPPNIGLCDKADRGVSLFLFLFDAAAPLRNMSRLVIVFALSLPSSLEDFLTFACFFLLSVA